MEKIIYIGIAIVVIGIVALAIIGLIQKKKERQFLKKYNEDSIKSFMDGKKKQKSSKYSRKSTPKVPSMKAKHKRQKK